MIRIDWLLFIQDLVWFGWYYQRTGWDDGTVTGEWILTKHKGITRRHPTTRICQWNTKK